MSQGLRFELVGAVQDKRNYDDAKSGEKVFGVQAAWLGGSEFFRLTSEQYRKAPETGEPVQIVGTLMLTKWGPRFQVQAIGAPVAAPNGQAEPGAAATRRTVAGA